MSKPTLNKNDPDSLYTWVANKVASPSFRNPIKNFIDLNCSTFVDVDENSLEQGQLFNEMNQLIEDLLQDLLEEAKISQEEFLKVAQKGLEDDRYKKYFNQIINFSDYNFFKSIMTKRNYQIIQLAERQMAGEDLEALAEEQKKLLSKQEQLELDEAIKQSLEMEDEKRRIQAIEEEEMRRAMKQSLIDSLRKDKPDDLKEEKKEEPKKEEPKKEEPKKEEPKKEEPKKEEPKKEEPKKEEPKKEEPKKKAPLNIISNNVNFQFEGETKKPEPKEEPKKEEKKEEEKVTNIISAQKGFEVQIASKQEFFGANDNKKKETPKPENKPIEKLEVTKPMENPTEEKPLIDNTNDNKPVRNEFYNIYEEKKRTLAPLKKEPIEQPKKRTLQEQIHQKKNINKKRDFSDLPKNIPKNEKKETAGDIIKSTLQTSENEKKEDVKKDLTDVNDDLIVDLNEDEEDVVFGNQAKEENLFTGIKKSNINFGKIAIPSDFNDKIPDYTKEKQEQLKEFRDMVINHKLEERDEKAKELLTEDELKKLEEKKHLMEEMNAKRK